MCPSELICRVVEQPMRDFLVSGFFLVLLFCRKYGFFYIFFFYGLLTKREVKSGSIFFDAITQVCVLLYRRTDGKHEGKSLLALTLLFLFFLQKRKRQRKKNAHNFFYQQLILFFLFSFFTCAWLEGILLIPWLFFTNLSPLNWLQIGILFERREGELVLLCARPWSYSQAWQRKKSWLEGIYFLFSGEATQ